MNEIICNKIKECNDKKCEHYKLHERNEDCYKSTCATLEEHINYRSFDAGKTWYREVKDSAECTTILKYITEETDETFKKMHNQDRLTEHVRKNGPIGQNGMPTEKEIELLNSIGVTVTKRDNTNE